MEQVSRVVLIGSYPPPYGGCSVHIQRLSNVLGNIYNVCIVDLYGDKEQSENRHIIRCGTKKPFNLIRAYRELKLLKPQIAHFHVSAMNNFVYVGKLLISSLAKECKKMITIHSGSFVSNFDSFGIFKKYLLRALLQSFDSIIVVNQEQARLLQGIGCDIDRISVIPAFLPPLAINTDTISKILANIAITGKRILISSGYGQEHYGYHHIIEAIDKMGDRAGNVHLLLCLYNTYDENYLDSLERELKQVVDYTLFRDLNPEAFSFLLSKSDVYIRATDRDGDAVAIREAGYFETKIVASNVVSRPLGSILFSLGDAKGLADAINLALDDDKSGLIIGDDLSNESQLIKLYSSMESFA